MLTYTSHVAPDLTLTVVPEWRRSALPAAGIDPAVARVLGCVIDAKLTTNGVPALCSRATLAIVLAKRRDLLDETRAAIESISSIGLL